MQVDVVDWNEQETRTVDKVGAWKAPKCADDMILQVNGATIDGDGRLSTTQVAGRITNENRLISEFRWDSNLSGRP